MKALSLDPADNRAPQPRRCFQAVTEQDIAIKLEVDLLPPPPKKGTMTQCIGVLDAWPL